MRQAEEDLRAAETLYSGGNYAWCCFACQQVAEKSLKSILEYLGRPSRGHNLVRLLKEIEKHVSVPDSVRRACFVLNRYYVATRYPNAFSSGAPVEMFDSKDAEEALNYAREVLNYAKSILGYT